MGGSRGFVTALKQTDSDTMRARISLRLCTVTLVLLAAVVLQPGASAADAPKKINVLLVTGDDVGGHPYSLPGTRSQNQNPSRSTLSPEDSLIGFLKTGPA